ncbi:MAG: ATP-binding cassette domain-containing protein, partial [Chitinophagaceae bacterium]
VNEVSFSVSKGEIVGFLGPNGAGKSTTMKMITGYLEPDNGVISVCGISVKDQPLEIKKKIGYLPEANPLYYDMYVREYLDFIAGVHNVSGPAKKIEEVIDLTGLRQESGKKIGQLSKGYKQRVGLAAALIHEPEVLILDEPTTGLDPNQIIEIREVIRNLGKDKTVLFSSHILQEVEALCDRVIIINKGQLVADDSISKLHDSMKGQYVKVSFGKAPEKSLMESLSGIVGKPGADGLTWTLETTNPDLLRKQLMELSLQHNLNIVSLQSGNSSLEDIFRELTAAKNDV